MSGFSGGPMDPVTRRLVDEQRIMAGDVQDDTFTRTRNHAERAAAFLPAAASDAARQLADIIETVLLARVRVVLENDPEAEAMLKILHEFDSRRDVAMRAVKILMNQNPDAPVTRTRKGENG